MNCANSAGVLHSSCPLGVHPWAWLSAAKLVPGFKDVLQDQSPSPASNNYLVSITFQTNQGTFPPSLTIGAFLSIISLMSI